MMRLGNAVQRLAVVAAMSIGLAGCGRTESYRYKLTLAVNTPNGVKRGSSVVEVTFHDVSFPAKGTMHKLNGEALYLDLGPGIRPLIALLTNGLPRKYDGGIGWSAEAGPDTRLMLKPRQAPSQDFMDDVPRIARMRVPHKIVPVDLPDLVTFADANDPKSVIEVDRNDLQASLGPNVNWNEISLESTDAPLTKGIAHNLPWIPAYFEKNLRLDGTKYGSGRELANRLDWWNFDQSGDLKRSK
jgi:hypothetical protein